MVTACVATLAIGGMVYAFVANASPYVTVAEARATNADRLHLAGDIDQHSVQADPSKRTLKFRLTDKTGESVTVLYTGPPLANFVEANKVVAIGRLENGLFRSNDMRVKCPSKYEAKTGR